MKKIPIFNCWNREKFIDFSKVFLSALVSAVLEFLRQVLIVLKNTGLAFNAVFFQAMKEQKYSILHSILIVFLLTAIVWCVSGIITILKKKDSSKSSFLSFVVFSVFAICSIWYTIEVLIKFGSFKFWISLFFVVLFYLVLVVFFCFEKDVRKPTSDYQIAAFLPKHK